MTQDLLQELEKHPFVQGFRPEHKAKLASLAKQVQFESDQVIFHEAAPHLPLEEAVRKPANSRKVHPPVL